MLALVAVYFGFTFLLTLTLGYLQTPFRLPGAMDAPHSGNIESILAVLAVCVQAFVSIVLLGGTVWFPPAAGFFSLTLLCHHAHLPPAAARSRGAMGGPGSPRVPHLPGLSVRSPDCPFPMHDGSLCKHPS
jgi:hypothetical protein